MLKMLKVVGASRGNIRAKENEDTINKKGGRLPQLLPFLDCVFSRTLGGGPFWGLFVVLEEFQVRGFRIFLTGIQKIATLAIHIAWRPFGLHNEFQQAAFSEKRCEKETALLMGSQRPSPANVKTLCNFETQILLDIITSRDAKGACFKGLRTSCREIIWGISWATFGQKRSCHVMDVSC